MAIRDHDHSQHLGHLGLAHDLALLTRRRWVGLVARAAAGLSLAPVLTSCGTGGPGGDDDGRCSTIPSETAGPFPGDGTNGANALVLSGIVRSDIRASIAGATGIAQGVVLVVTLTLVDSQTCAPLADHAIYLWHCDRDGNYSMYAGAVAGENYLRGVQATDSAGQATFTTVFPGCYPGRWPHMHFEIYPTLASATNGSARIAVSQLALPQTACDSAYASAGYGASLGNLSRITLAGDGVFADGADRQMATTTGSVAAGYTAALTVPI